MLLWRPNVAVTRIGAFTKGRQRSSLHECYTACFHGNWSGQSVFESSQTLYLC